MLFGKDIPFPENETCKICITRPCKKLFAGRVYAGKMVFVHKSRFLSLPCNTPALSEQAEESQEPAALTDDIEVIEEQVEISNPRWEPLEEAEAGGDPETPLIGDTIKLLADVKNHPEGGKVSFDIYDSTENPPLRIETVGGTNKGGTATVEWVVKDPNKRGESLKLDFEAGARSKFTSRAQLPWQDKIRCDFVEIPDVLFHHNSAVPCLDEEGTLLGAVVAAFAFAKENPNKEIVLFGHTDTSGDPAYNYDLSEWRAEGIKALLDNDAELWLDVIELASKVEDYQQILKTLSSAHGWSCDPGKVDNANGPKTKEGLKVFQEQYNQEYKGVLKVDGIIGPKTWKALFEVVRSIIEEAVKSEVGDTLPSLTYGYGGKGFYACGESFPIDNADNSDYRSKTNRRVEMVFFDKGKAPELLPPADKKKVEKKEKPVYDKKKTEKKPIPVKSIKQPEVSFFLLNDKDFNGVDVYEEITLNDKDGNKSKQSPPPRDDIYSFELNKKVIIDVIIKDVELPQVFFVSSDEALCTVKDLHPTSSPFKLEICTGTKNDVFGCVEARIGSKNGKTAGKIWLAIYSQVVYKAKIYSVFDSKSNNSKVSKTFTTDQLKNNVFSTFKPGCVNWQLEAAADTDVEYDLNKNGALDIEPGTNTKELKAIIDACPAKPGFARVVIVKKLRWNYYIASEVKDKDTQIKLKSYNSVYIGYFGKGNYTIADEKGNKAEIKIKSVDAANAKITLDAPVGKNFKLSDKPALLFPLGGLSGDPTLISESSISSKTALLNTIGHELGHTCGGLKDVCEVGNIMYGIVQSDNPPLKLRKRGIPLYYTPSKKEEQWSQLKRI